MNKKLSKHKKKSVCGRHVNTKGLRFPVFMERGVDGFYVAQCPVIDGCFTQGKTLDETLANMKEAIELCLEEELRTSSENLDVLYKDRELSLHTVIL